MGHTCNSILIKAPYDKVFDISNDIPRWTELFGGEYKEAKILKKEGNKLTFRLTDDEGNSWQSFRLLFKENYFAYAEKEEPKFPFQYMKIIWLYTPTEEGIIMTWIQHFAMDKNAKYTDSQVEELINKHSQENLKIFKEIIERESVE
jgi:aromatase